jgi:D-alanyl-D-alanine carboxypeptidase (penicillin-binding protein 5/6)
MSSPIYGASALGAVGFADALITGGTDQALSIASITKIIAALVVLEKYPLAPEEAGPTLYFDNADVSIYRKFLANNGKVVPVSTSLPLSQR